MLLDYGCAWLMGIGVSAGNTSLSRWVLVTPAGIFYFLSIAFCNSSRITADLLSALVRSSYNSGSWFRLIRMLTQTVFSAFHLLCHAGSAIDFYPLSCYTLTRSRVVGATLTRQGCSPSVSREDGQPRLGEIAASRWVRGAVISLSGYPEK